MADANEVFRKLEAMRAEAEAILALLTKNKGDPNFDRRITDLALDHAVDRAMAFILAKRP